MIPVYEAAVDHDGLTTVNSFYNETSLIYYTHSLTRLIYLSAAKNIVTKKDFLVIVYTL